MNNKNNVDSKKKRKRSISLKNNDKKTIFLFNYFETFKNLNKKNRVIIGVEEEISPKQRFWLSLVLSVTTAPYTSMIPLDLFLDLF